MELVPVRVQGSDKQEQTGRRVKPHYNPEKKRAGQADGGKGFALSAPGKPVYELAIGVRQLWSAIDSTRAAAHFLLAVSLPSTNQHLHSQTDSRPLEDPAFHSFHEGDFGAQSIRLECDLLDIQNLVHVFISTLRVGGSPAEFAAESLSRVSSALKRRAYIMKSYVAGADVHMTFHELFQLEHLPNWSELALQRMGTPGGPLHEHEELTEPELGWCIEGLQHSCFYHPSAEKRLTELARRFSDFSGRVDLCPTAALSSVPPPAPEVDAWAAAAAYHPLGFSPSLGTGTGIPLGSPLFPSPPSLTTVHSSVVGGLPQPRPQPDPSPPLSYDGASLPSLLFEFGGSDGADGGGGGGGGGAEGESASFFDELDGAFGWNSPTTTTGRNGAGQ
ncbi:hypothetical protein JCM11641_006637 [Rhodosporidiobolus odoratus]